MKIEANDIADLQPLITAAVRATLIEIRAASAQVDAGRIGYLEQEAADLLGIAKHVLADARRRGSIKARRVGKAYVYSRSTLVEYLEGCDGD